MAYTYISDPSARRGVNVWIKLGTTFGAMLALSFLDRTPLVLAGGFVYCMLLAVVLRLDAIRLLKVAARFLLLPALLMIAFVAAVSVVHGTIDVQGFLRVAGFLEILLVGLIYASVSSVADFRPLARIFPSLQGVAIGYRVLTLIGDSIHDYAAVVRQREAKALEKLEVFFAHLLIRGITLACLLQENARLKGTCPA